ncbi:3-(3-hydroxy-phenyl)propionate hydroxylase [Actinophytocola oryzae]|uniref:3-(3-hydroxy-phenyl)propionate hydroxylase n=1 Tax=Actinophytocola oryzae TaxID=502181 RepID=A0A4R7UYS9_9PSEU|nr:3-(3-hydroxy-phenyl)propionate hydroxylase [Actinophytocola oryzae]
MVGAGPVGMTAALLLARHGVPTTVLEAAPARELVGSRSICVQGDVLDILARAGVGAQVAEVGVTWTRGRTYYRSHQVGEIRFPEVGSAAFPPFVNTPQTVVELLLEQAVAEEPLVELRYDQPVEALTQDADSVTVATPHGTVTGTHCVAADGARSTVRDLLGLPFDGMSYEDRFLIADIRADLGFTAERRFYFDPPWNPGRQVLVHPQPGGVWRVDWQVPADFDLATEDLDSRIRRITGDAPYEIVWLSLYRFHQRRIPEMRVGRVLLAGDAAHVMSPFGARGLNSGIADADNLAWKVALDREALAGPSLLSSYDVERGAAAEENLRVTSETMRFLVPRTPEEKSHREDVLTRSITDESARAEINAGRLAEPYSYEASPLTTSSGALCPDAQLMRGGRLRELGVFTVLTNWSDWRPSDPWERAVVGEVIPLDQEDDTTLADALNLKPRQAVVVRPDGHVAAVLTEPRGGIGAPINAALRRATGWVH